MIREINQAILPINPIQVIIFILKGILNLTNKSVKLFINKTVENIINKTTEIHKKIVFFLILLFFTILFSYYNYWSLTNSPSST